jgi:hypothetical protein
VGFLRLFNRTRHFRFSFNFTQPLVLHAQPTKEEASISDGIAVDHLWEDNRKSLRIGRAAPNGRRIFSLSFRHFATAIVYPESSEVLVWAKESNILDPAIDHLVSDQIIPRVVAHGPGLVLHASLIESRNVGVAILGYSGYGKSTLATSLYGAGYTLHGDDTTVINASGPPYFARSLYPSLRLFPDSLKMLFPAEPEFQRVAHYTDKLRVKLPSSRGQLVSPVALGALVFLNSPPADSQVVLRRMQPAATCIALIENSFALDPTDPDRSRGKFNMASELAGTIPAYELTYPRDYARLGDVRRALVEMGILPPVDHETASSSCVA